MSSARQLDLIAESLDLVPPQCQVGWVYACERCGTHRRVTTPCPGCGACGRRDGRSPTPGLGCLPRVPIRHWVYRPAKAHQAGLCGARRIRRAVGQFMQAIFEVLRRLVALQWDRHPRADAVGGGMAVLHVTGASLERDPHFHALVLDGVYVERHGEPVFLPLVDDPPAQVLQELAGRLDRVGRSWGAGPRGRGTVGATSIPGPVAIRRGPSIPVQPRDGFQVRQGRASVFAGLAVPPERLDARRRLHRYLVRPVPDPAAGTLLPTGRVRFRLARPFSDGTTHLEFAPDDLRRRLAELGPAASGVSLHGVLAPRSRWRRRVFPGQLILFEDETGRARNPSDPVRADPSGAPPAPACCGRAMHLQAVERAGTHPREVP